MAWWTSSIRSRWTRATSAPAPAGSSTAASLSSRATCEPPEQIFSRVARFLHVLGFANVFAAPPACGDTQGSGAPARAHLRAVGQRRLRRGARAHGAGGGHAAHRRRALSGPLRRALRAAGGAHRRGRADRQALGWGAEAAQPGEGGPAHAGD